MIGSVLYIEALPWPNWEKKKIKEKISAKIKSSFLRISICERQFRITISIKISEKAKKNMGMTSRTPWIFNVWGQSGLHPFWISQEVVRQPWCDLTTRQRRSYCASKSRYSPLRLCSKMLLNEHVLYDLH